MRTAILLAACLFTATALAPAASADHGTDIRLDLCNLGGEGGVVGVVIDAAIAATCITVDFVNDGSHLVMCVLVGGTDC